jgi:hypothetical protein
MTAPPNLGFCRQGRTNSKQHKADVEKQQEQTRFQCRQQALLDLQDIPVKDLRDAAQKG